MEPRMNRFQNTVWSDWTKAQQPWRIRSAAANYRKLLITDHDSFNNDSIKKWLLQKRMFGFLLLQL